MASEIGEGLVRVREAEAAGTVGWLIDELLKLPLDLSVCRYDSEYGERVVSSVEIEKSSTEGARYVSIR